MICYKTWYVIGGLRWARGLTGYLRREYRHVIGGQMHQISNRRTRVARILALLIESGVLYFLFFVGILTFGAVLRH